MTTSTQPRLAVLIDAENTCAAHADQMMARIAALGRPIVRRAYGDWATPQLLTAVKVCAAGARQAAMVRRISPGSESGR